MKTIKILSVFASAALLVSCSGFLKEYNPLGLTTIYDSPEVLESSISGVLEGFDGWWGLTGETVEFFGAASGLQHWGGTGTGNFDSQQHKSCLYFTQYSTTKYNGDYFKQMYVVVTRANSFLAALKNSDLEESLKKEAEGEVRFYRALAYYFIVRTWGDCPMRLKPDTSESATNCPRTPYYQVYDFIVKELEFAEQNMRTPDRVKAVTPQMPRPNKFAATAVLASVYCTLGSLLASPDDNFWDNSKPERRPDFSEIGLSKDDYAMAATQAYTKALEYAKKIIPGTDTHDPACTYALVEKHGDLFNFDPAFSRNGYTAWLNPEQIVSLSSTITGTLESPYAKYVLPQYPAGTACNIDNTQYGRIRPSRWLFQTWCQHYPGNVSTTSSANYISSTDPRLDNTMYYGKMTYSNGSGTLSCYPSYLNANSKASSYPYYKKSASKRYNVNISDADVYVIRLAEIYFIAAEAAAYLDDETAARGYIETIHARARHSVADGAADSAEPTWTGKTFATKQDLLDAIFWEKVFELSGEHVIEYLETHRHGARFIIRNICIPKNTFLTKAYHKDLLGSSYPKDWVYPSDPNSDPDEVGSDVFTIRKGLLAAFPQSECIYNAAISEQTDVNDYTF